MEWKREATRIGLFIALWCWYDQETTGISVVQVVTNKNINSISGRYMLLGV